MRQKLLIHKLSCGLAAFLTSMSMLAVLAIGSPVQAEERLALVIGNAAYVVNPALDNPANDATLMAQTLGSLGFQVTEIIDGEQAAMKSAIAEFGRKLRAAGPDTVGLFYYAGHAVQSMGSNYLIPIGSTIRDAADLDLVGVESSWVLRQMESARNVTNIVILDACRDNPFALAGAGSQGLARMDAPTGTFIAYATAPGDVALDGTGPNSPFTAALAAAMTEPGLPIEQMFKQVRVAVLEATVGAQTPWDSSSLVRDFAFRPAAVTAAGETAEQRLWDEVRSSGDAVQLVLFLRSYPESRFAAEARALLNDALAGPAAAADGPASTPPAPAVASAAETALFESARAASTAEGYEAYLAAFPSGLYADLAQAEVASLAAQAVGSAGPATTDGLLTAVIAGRIGFAAPLASDDAMVAGRSIEQLSRMAPHFSPVEGLDAAAWQDQSCSACHQWTRDALCEQGQFYLREGDARTMSKVHPHGGGFKVALREWAAADCP